MAADGDGGRGPDLTRQGCSLVDGFDRKHAPDGWTLIRALTDLHGVAQPIGDQKTIRDGEIGYAPAHVVERLERRGLAEEVDDDEDDSEA